jgi:hypothetical protein
MNEYIPGVCNIGPAEIAQRKRIGWIGLLVTIIAWVLLAYFSFAPWWFVVLFFPAAMSATGFIQGFSHFCAGFGMQGVLNFGPEVGKTDTVSQAEFRAADRKKALEIFAWSVIAGIVVAAVAVWVG